ncbi:MAG: hypothetical protein ABL962_06840 [Fimbriimonadaceae bacterium]
MILCAFQGLRGEVLYFLATRQIHDQDFTVSDDNAYALHSKQIDADVRIC